MLGFSTSSIKSYKIIMLIRGFQTTAVKNQGATSCWKADAMGANTWPIPLRTSPTVHVIQRLLRLNLKWSVNHWFQISNEHYVSVVMSNFGPSLKWVYYIYFLRRYVPVKEGPTERMTSYECK